MLLEIGSKIKFNKLGFIDEDKQFRLNEISKIDFNKEYNITELYHGPSVDKIDTDIVLNFVFWVEGINIEFCEEHIYDFKKGFKMNGKFKINNNDLKSIKKLLSNGSISHTNKEEIERLCIKIDNHLLFEQLSDELRDYITEKSNHWQSLIQISYLDDDLQILEASIECEDDIGPSTFTKEKFNYTFIDNVFSFSNFKK